LIRRDLCERGIKTDAALIPNEIPGILTEAATGVLPEGRVMTSRADGRGQYADR
jgi:hypothetical protein